MQVEYKKTRRVGCLTINIVLFALLIISMFFYSRDKIWDFEGFEFGKIFTILSGLFMIWIFKKDERVTILGDRLLINNKEVSFSEIKSVECSSYYITLELKEKTISFSRSLMKNDIAFFEFLVKEKHVPLKVTNEVNWWYKPLITLGFIAFLMFLASFMGFTRPFTKNLKYQLPLVKIKTIELEGTLSGKAKVYNYSRQDGEANIMSFIKLQEYPEYLFKYVKSKDLKDERINLEGKELNIGNNQRVRIKIRKKDFERMENSQPLWNAFSTKDNAIIKYYSLNIGNKLLMEKCCLK